MKKLVTKEVFEVINDTNVKLIDIRPIDLYNGWKLNNESRGGHIKGAKSLPYKWMNYIDWIEIVRNKEINPNNKIIIYGHNEDQIEKVANNFLKFGYTDVSVYKNFMDSWIEDKNLPMEKLHRYNKLVSAPWLNQLINEGTAPEYKNTKYVICHAHYRNKDDYDEGHIPGSIEIDTNELESPETWNRRNPEELKKALESFGIDKDTTVILYGRFSYPNNDDPFPGSSSGHLGSIRCALIMMYAGVSDVRILNGGLQSWEDENYPIIKKEKLKTPIEDFGVGIPSNKQLIVDIDEAKEIIESNNKNLVSVRSWSQLPHG